MAAIRSNSIQPFAVAACSNKQEIETVHSGKAETAEVAHNIHVLQNDTENANNASDSLQNHVNGAGEEALHDNSDEMENAEPVIDIFIRNVVCAFAVRCHINLKRLAMEGSNVEYRREYGICNMKLRRPRVTANITSSGKITVTGSTSEDEAKVAARRVARRLQKMGFKVRFFNFRIVNVLGTCGLPFGIRLNNFSTAYPQAASYEPELHPGLTYKIKKPKATMKVFSTGSITITAPCVDNVGLAVEHIYPLVSDFQMAKRQPPPAKKAKPTRPLYHPIPLNGYHVEDDELEDGEVVASDFDSEDEDFDSDVSHD